MKISIVIPYYNKREILLNTLRSINLFVGNDTETIVVDDGSDPQYQVGDICERFPRLNIRLIVLEKNGWRGPAIAYNTGFNEASGDVIFLNGADCLHMGNLLGYVDKNFEDGMYINFSAYRGTDFHNELFKWVNWNDPRPLMEVKKSLDLKASKNWHIHSEYFYELAPFCAAIGRSDLETLSGFDERFEHGIGFEDSDFTCRISNLKLNAILIDEPFCMHQRHEPTKYSNTINRDLFLKLQEESPQRIKANHNKIYIR
jgi:O-antigen biosynthesis protein